MSEAVAPQEKEPDIAFEFDNPEKWDKWGLWEVVQEIEQRGRRPAGKEELELILQYPRSKMASPFRVPNVPFVFFGYQVGANYAVLKWKGEKEGFKLSWVFNRKRWWKELNARAVFKK